MNIKHITPVVCHSPRGDSPYTACDMGGNVWEWCRDGYDEKAYEKRLPGQIIDPTGPANDSKRTVRGGSWNDPYDGIRAAFRSGAPADTRNHVLGFRVVSASASGH